MTRRLAAFCCVVFFCAASTASGATPLEDARWVKADADLFRILSQSPGECLGPVATDDAYRVNVGAVAFRSPFLFGGVAARAGVSCNSCHRDGHDNRDFYFDGLSDAPGTADVTSSVFSKTREDGVFNPLPIPNLVGIAGKETFGTRTPHGSIEDFVASAVTEEFNGEAAPFLVAAVADYVSRLRSAYCPPRGLGAAVWLDLKYPRIALEIAETALQRGDAATADFLLLSARGLLKRVDERFEGDGLAQERSAIRALAAAIGDVREKAAAEPGIAPAAIQSLLRQFDLLAASLSEAEKQSLYNREVLRRHLAAPTEQAN